MELFDMTPEEEAKIEAKIRARDAEKKRIAEAIRSLEDQKMMNLIERDLLRLEALYETKEINAPANADQKVTVERGLTAMYRSLNLLLAKACVEMKYPLCQWEWNDSLPVDAVAKLYPILYDTQWFQRQTSLVLMTPNNPRHPWIDLMCFGDVVGVQ